MEESVFYIAEGKVEDKHSQESFALATSVHTSLQHASFRQANCPQNGAVLTGVGHGERLFVASPNKALLNIYSWGKESIDQKIPIPEALNTIAITSQPQQNDSEEFEKLPGFRTPWLLAGGSKSGKIYIWELASGNLLCVKDAHYQGVSVLKFSKCGGFLVSGGLDARCMVWRTSDLISIYNGLDNTQNAKPFQSFTDHTLPITDLVLSNSGIANDMRLYTVSRDGTLRIYDILTKALLTTFVLTCAIECVNIDPANRAIYVGLSNGSIRTIPLYNINPKTSVLESIGGNGKIITLDSDPNLVHTFVHHLQRVQDKEQGSILHKGSSNSDLSNEILVTRLVVSFDGTNIISGDSLGRVFVSDVHTRQVLKSFTPCNSPISYISTAICPTSAVISKIMNNNNDKKHRLIPQLKRVLANDDAKDHQLYIEIPGSVEVKQDFKDWLEHKAEEELEFKNISNIKSSVTTIGEKSSNESITSELEEKVEKISKAYKELRSKYEDLYNEHSKLL